VVHESQLLIWQESRKIQCLLHGGTTARCFQILF